ncbi:MAG: carbohydrate binding domain-containing protein [Armatimonadota bacterium]
MSTRRHLAWLIAAAFAVCAAFAEEPIAVKNGDFESGADMASSGWAWWSRDDKGSAQFSADSHSGKRCVRLEYDGERDWAFSNSQRLDVEPGQIWTAAAWIKCEGSDGLDLAIVALSGGKTLRWSIGSDGVSGTRDWTQVQAVAYIPPGCDQVYVRFVGRGDTLAWVDDVTIRRGKPTPKHPPKPKVSGWAKKRVDDRLARGLVAMPIQGAKTYLGWRLLKSDPADVAFNVYRAVEGGRPRRLNSKPIARTTDFIDESPPLEKAVEYWVRPIVAGRELRRSEAVRVGRSPEVKPYISIGLEGDYTFQKVGIADLNGDGRYDYVIKQPNSNIDPYRLYWKPSPDTYKIEAYLDDGTFLWRNDLGWAIERGIWYSPYVVYDLDGDGKAEVAVKTGEGDPRDEDGRVRSGPEYLSIWDGMTGREKTRVEWPSREGFTGSAGYNFASRNQLGIAYLDGKTPCLLVARGTYTTMKLVAYQYRHGRLKRLWSWDNREEHGLYRGQGAHFMHSADVDGDGRDEVILGSCVVDDNGQGLWATGLGHPDHCYVGDVDPSRPGLEVYYGIEPGQLQNAVCLVDAKTGDIIWGIKERTYHVHASGLCSDFDATHPGMECYSGEKEMPKGKPRRWLHSARGELLATEETWDVGLSPRAVYWDADPQRELVRGRRVFDYRGDTHTEAIEGSQVAWADVVGDWREEIITSVEGELRIYTTTIPATDRRVCLMQDPIYRLDVAHLAMGYPQPPMTSFCLSAESPGRESASPRSPR